MDNLGNNLPEPMSNSEKIFYIIVATFGIVVVVGVIVGQVFGGF